MRGGRAQIDARPRSGHAARPRAGRAACLQGASASGSWLSASTPQVAAASEIVNQSRPIWLHRLQHVMEDADPSRSNTWGGRHETTCSDLLEAVRSERETRRRRRNEAFPSPRAKGWGRLRNEIYYISPGTRHYWPVHQYTMWHVTYQQPPAVGPSPMDWLSNIHCCCSYNFSAAGHPRTKALN